MNAETITVTDCEGHSHQAQLIAGNWEDGCGTIGGRAVKIWNGEVDMSCWCAIGSTWEGFDDLYEVVQNGDGTTWKEITE